MKSTVNRILKMKGVNVDAFIRHTMQLPVSVKMKLQALINEHNRIYDLHKKSDAINDPHSNISMALYKLKREYEIYAKTKMKTGDNSYGKWMTFKELYTYLLTGAEKNKKPSERKFKKRLDKFLKTNSDFIQSENGKYRIKYRELSTNIEYFLNKRIKIPPQT